MITENHLHLGPHMSEVMPTYSVALATYNGAPFILTQLESVLNQSVEASEIVVSDDVSSDATRTVLNSIAAQYQRVVLVFQDSRLGYRENFNRCLAACSSDVVFLCDQDDHWHQDKALRVMRCMVERPTIDLVIHDIEYCDAKLTPTGMTKLSRLRAIGDPMQSYVVGMATAVRRSFLELCLPIPDVPGLSHDRWLHDCARVLGRKLILPEVLALYRRHSSNATADNPINRAKSTGSWRLRWQLMKRRLLPSAGEALPSHFPLLEWLERHRHTFVERGYLSEAAIAALIAEHAARRDSILQRAALTHLPRWRRWLAVLHLYAIGGYAPHFTWRSALGDALRNADTSPPAAGLP